MSTSVIAHNIVSPLGMTSEQNYAAVKDGCSALCYHEGKWQLPEGFTASLFADDAFPVLAGHTRFESLAIASIRAALEQTHIDVASPRTVLIISTTKGNVELLERREDCQKSINDGQEPSSDNDEREYPGMAALSIASTLGFTTTPIVVCNACISGAVALILAHRLLTAGLYDTAVVCGADCQSKFIVSGFQSFKALSPTPCRPFDAARDGLNLGEAAATICLSSLSPIPSTVGRGDSMSACANQQASEAKGWHIADGCVRNDANHISGPSRTGEGCFRVLRNLLKDTGIDGIDFINVHGTATLYNDEMESIALERAGLTSTPVNALKGYYGHTMGAAGVLETIISMLAANDHTLPATRGYASKGVSGNITVNSHNSHTKGQSFIKLLSGFGGCNAALRLAKGDSTTRLKAAAPLTVAHRVTITAASVTVDGSPLPTSATGVDMLTELYRMRQMAYPKYFKMDTLSRLGFIASELLLSAEGEARKHDCEDRAVILFNRSSSIVADRQHQALIDDSGNFFPSPSVFVYTLPNIVTGEIAIRNHYYGETALYILPQRNDALMDSICQASLLDSTTTSILGGWIDCESNDSFEADMTIMTFK